MDIEKLIERLKERDGLWCSIPTGEQLISDAVTALSTLQAENARLRKERDKIAEDFVDYVTGGVPNPSIYCANRKQSCVDMRAWCTGKNCDGFSPKAKRGIKED